MPMGEPEWYNKSINKNMSVHDENNATVYKCKNCNKYYTDHFSKKDIEEHTSGKCKRDDIKSNKIPLQEQIDSILDNFDFERVKEVMDKLNWYWGGEDDKTIPEIPDLRKYARRMLNDIKDKNSGYQLSCGGFVAEKFAENGLELRFEITSLNGFDVFGEDVEFDDK